MWKEDIVVYFKPLYQYWPGGTSVYFYGKL